MKISIVGLQWGDEGKGKIIDLLAPKFDLVVRYQGGPNAGHTVHRGDKKFIFHQLPSGVLHEGVTNLIGSGCVINPETLFGEIDALNELNIDCVPRLKISKFAHLIFPYHILFDKLRESGKKKSLGTTKRGVGMCYEDKFARIGIRLSDLFDEEKLSNKLKYLISHKNFLLIEQYSCEPLNKREILKEYLAYGKKLKTMAVVDPSFIDKFRDKKILFEGAQGTLLDINFGTYPYVTSSNPIAGGVGISAGCLFPELHIIGIVKSYTTRVGLGPFPTEEGEPVANKLRDRGKEYGSTTGRPRRCGWLDATALRYASLINGVKSIILTKLDVLTGFDQLQIGIGYENENSILEDYDPSLDNLKPVYKTVTGWHEDLTNIKDYNSLPGQTKSYVSEIEKLSNTKVIGISVGPKPNQIIWREKII